MKVLVIDREALTNQLLISKLSAKGHEVIAEPNKQAAFELLKNDGFDCIMVDPAPLSEAKPVIFAVMKNVPAGIKPYLLLLSKTATTEDAILAGANEVINKPLSSQDIETKIGNAERLLEIYRQLARVDDVHSEGGMIGKAAFNQLFLSAIDRAFRYGERSLIVFVALINHQDIVSETGEDVFEDIIRQLTEKMTFMRRQSDVIGRLGQHEFAILLQRPQYETEPLDAINRFSEVLDKFHRTFENKNAAPRLQLTLIEVPQGAKHAERSVPIIMTED